MQQEVLSIQMRKLPIIIIQEEFEKIFAKETNKEYKLAYLLGFEAGMRISEIVGLKVKGEWKIKPLTQENINSSSIKIIGKGNKERIVPRPKRMNVNAMSLLPLKILRRSLQMHITAIGAVVLGKRITFHTLRHGFGSHLANAGRPLHEIQMLMGHSRLDTTGIYLHANPKQALDKASEAF